MKKRKPKLECEVVINLKFRSTEPPTIKEVRDAISIDKQLLSKCVLHVTKIEADYGWSKDK